ncbi:hypothetical protein [Amycolatopsis sp. PS_44_ISF1]|uniref:hypothetical protein n=1 Tax=Amycolatopsis sp. PS_44_ISF1 TaxID=2974917 RepID=UPI0028DF662A|nr:hypothetical protein [Amycolatopsis sp. PS_44_ISF1]MDT8914171.1 hypothetical protein [Amycolatopsis sp. PS_44_ISF1]
MIADKAYSYPAAHWVKQDRRIGFVSPERDGQLGRRATKGSCSGRPPVVDAQVDK